MGPRPRVAVDALDGWPWFDSTSPSVVLMEFHETRANQVFLKVDASEF